MPNWNEVLKEIQGEAEASPLDRIRRKYLMLLSEKTGRNVIAYYSGWLNHPGTKGTDIFDNDKNGFMNAVHNLDRSLGLDLILHTPGGSVAAAESLVDYLHKMFGFDIRAIIPQIAMSAGTMIACACKSVVMGKQSNLGPIDPHISGIPAKGVLKEFDRAVRDSKTDKHCIPFWQAIISKYHPTFIEQCQNAIRWSNTVVKDWLRDGMFRGEADAEKKIENIIYSLTEQDETYSHDRHISIDKCEEMELKVERLEEMKDDIQDIVLTIHHAYMHTFSQSNVIKIIENQNGKAMLNFTSKANH